MIKNFIDASVNTDDAFSLFSERIQELSHLFEDIKKHGGYAYLVGGSVRDMVMGLRVKDFDIEVHRLSLEQLEKILKKYGFVSYVGKAFGVFKVQGIDADFSLPRHDSKGRKPEVALDPFMGIEKACMRRDVTMNALALNVHDIIPILGNLSSLQELCKHIIDPCNGLRDIKNRVVRAVRTTTFVEDPLRFYRVMQFVARFEMRCDEELENLCATMSLRDPVTEEPLASERVFAEIEKLCLRSKRPSLGFRWLQKIGRLKELFPELYECIGVLQRQDYHPEGDVFEHSMQACDASAEFEKFVECFFPEYKESPDFYHQKLVLMLAVLCHDLGKPATWHKDEKGIIHAWDHEKVGVDIARKMLQRLTSDRFLIRSVEKLVRYHMMPGLLLQQGAQQSAYKRLAYKLAPCVTIWQLGFVALCDRRGRNHKSHNPLPFDHEARELVELFLEKVHEADVFDEPEKPLVLGRDILHFVEPGPKMGELLDRAYHVQIDEGIKDKDELIKRIKEIAVIS